MKRKYINNSYKYSYKKGIPEVHSTSPLDETQPCSGEGALSMKKFHPSALTRRAQQSVAATTVRSTDFLFFFFYSLFYVDSHSLQ